MEKQSTENTQTKIENSLIENNEIFALLVNAVSDYAIFSLDPNGIIQTWNPGGERLKGYTSEEAIGTHFSRFYTPEDNARNHPAFELKQALKNGTYEEEGWRVKKDGSLFWASVIITSLKDKNGIHRGFAKVTRDLTQKKKAEDELQLAYDDLENKVQERTAELAHAKNEALKAVQARDEFLSIASHELNTPLTSLKLQTQLRKRQLSKGNTAILTPEGISKMFQSDEKQINRLGRLVDDMLDISRISSGNFSFTKEDTNLGMLVNDVIGRFSSQLETIGIQVISEASSPVVGHWDRYRIEQVVSNLLTNAMKYGNRNPIVIKMGINQDKAYLSVIDQGIGISKKDQNRIFKQYERAVSANMISGLGLGLYIVKQIIVHHGGSVSMESHLGKGSTFTVTLPLNS